MAATRAKAFAADLAPMIGELRAQGISSHNGIARPSDRAGYPHHSRRLGVDAGGAPRARDARCVRRPGTAICPATAGRLQLACQRGSVAFWKASTGQVWPLVAASSASAERPAMGRVEIRFRLSGRWGGWGPHLPGGPLSS
jgi:hypothetical protein